MSDDGRLAADEIRQRTGRLDDEWELVEDARLRRVFRFPDFAQALDFVNQVGAIAEEQNHHPDLHLTWGKVEVEVWSHDVGGLSTRDFEFATACDRLSGAGGSDDDA